ncbi:MAG TPA: Trm112 family protein [Chloroflexota bacterium]|nr:Trm112 family protein [Chloroflexota bacterium]
MNRGLLGLLVGLVAAIGGTWVARRFLGSSAGGEEPGQAGTADPYGTGGAAETAGAVGTAGSTEAGGPPPHREGLDPMLLEILACPEDKQPVIYQKEDQEERLTCTSCGRRYPVRDGIPVMLIDEASSGPIPTAAEIAAARSLQPQGKPAIVGEPAEAVPQPPAPPPPEG